MERSKIRLYCQFCLIEQTQEREMVRISSDLRRKFFAVTHQKLNTTRFSDTICSSPCLREISDAFDYRENLLKNQTILSDLFNSMPGSSHMDGSENKPVDIKVEDDFDDEFMDEDGISHQIFHVSPTVKLEEEPEAEDEFKLPAARKSLKRSMKSKKNIAEEGPFKCPECPDREFAKKLSLRVHFREFHRPNPDLRQICPQCGKICNNSRSLHNHMVYHRTEKNYQCEVCSKQFISTGDLRRHKIIHEAVKPHVCSFCNKGFTQSTSLKQHLNIHYNIKFTCDRCGASLSEKKTLQRHLEKCIRGVKFHSRVPRGTSGRINVKYECFVVGCDRTFTVRKQLGVHLEEVHNMKFNNFASMCHLCQQEFDTVGEYKVHYKTHSCNFICDICKHRFKTDGKLQDHIKNRHKEGEERPFICPELDCGARFKIQAHLKVHLLYKHSDEREIECEFCDAKFRKRSALVVHLRTHTDSKPFSCWQCEHICSRSTNLQEHMKRVHNELRIYCCEVCSQPFQYKQEVLQHEKEHTA